MLKQDQSVKQDVKGDHNKVAGRDFHDHSKTIIKKEAKGHFFENIRTGGGNFSVGDMIGGDKITQIFQGRQGIPLEKIPGILRKAGKIFYEGITGGNGRFEHLTIDEHLLAHVEEPGKENKPKTLFDHLDATHSNVLLMGEGGMGKTVSMLWIWQQWLDRENIIPIYVALNEYNRVSQAIREEFITQYIGARYLGGTLDSITKNNLKDWLDGKTVKKRKDKRPTVVLLLDGLNEITTDITPLLIDLNEYWGRLAQEGKIRIIVSSRFESNHQFTEGFSKLKVLPIDDDRMKDFLGNSRFDELDDSLKELLSVPMLLTLYSGLQNNQRSALPIQLRPINSMAELIWNYLEIQLHQFEKENQGDDKIALRIRSHFLINYVLPFIAYHMEKAELQEVTEKELEQVILAAFNRFNEPDFLKEFSFRSYIKLYRMHIDALQVGELSLVKEIGRFELLLEYFQRFFFPVVKEGRILRFTHDSFQVYFASRHVLNEIHFSLEKSEIPSILKDQILPENLQETLGQLAGEHYNRPSLATKKNKWENYNRKTSLGFAMDLCRGIHDEEQIGHCVWNILQIWKKLRGSFAGADFSGLHLSGFNFNGIESNRYDSEAIIDSKWDGCVLTPKQLFSEGHLSEVTMIRLSPDGKILASASADHTIKLWRLDTMDHIHDLAGTHSHTDEVNCIAFSPDGTKIASGGMDNKLIEWSAETGQCLKVYRGHRKGILQLDYHPSGEKILALYDGGMMGEWSTLTGVCLSWFYPNEVPAQCFCYIKEGSAFLVGVERGSMMEISGLTKMVAREYPQRNVLALTLSPSGKEFIAVAKNKDEKWDIREWKMDMEEELKIFDFKYPPRSIPEFRQADVTYSPSGEYLLVAGLDENVYEWALKDPLGTKMHYVTQVFKGHVRKVSSVAYFKNETHFFSGSFDASIRKWSTSSGQVVHSFAPNLIPYNAICKMPGSPYVLACSEDGDIHGIHVNELRLSRRIKAANTAYCIAYFKTEKAETDRIVTGGKEGTIQIWDIKMNHISELKEHQSTVSSLALDQKSGLVASADMDGNLILWSLKEVRVIEGTNTGEVPITHVAIASSEDGLHFIATSDLDGVITIWNKELKKLIEFDHGYAVFTMDVCVLNDTEQYLLSGGRDGRLIEWNIQTGEQNLIMDVSGENEFFTYVGYSPDFKAIIAGTDKNFMEITKYRASDKMDIRKFEGHDDYIIDVAFDPDGNSFVPGQGRRPEEAGKYLYSTSQDLTLKKWNLKTAELEKSVMNYPGLKVKYLDFSNVEWIEPLTDEEFEMLQHYGATLLSKQTTDLYR